MASMSELVPNLAKRLLLSTLAMLTSVVTALSIGNPSEASPARSQVQSVVAYAYNSPFFDEPSHGTASERGPPVGYDRTTTYDAVDRWSHGALARHNAAAAGATTIYTISPTLVQTAGATTTTGRHVEVIDGGFRALRADRVAAKSADEFVDLASAQRRTHILYGDKTGGGHLWPGLPGKTPFPKDWSANRVMHEISDVATDPKSVFRTGRGGSTIVTGTRDGVDIRVILRNGDIVTGHPTNLPRNP